MLRVFLTCLALCALALPAVAQSTTRPSAVVVTTCGTPPTSAYATPGSTQPVVMDVNGNLCMSGAGSATASTVVQGPRTAVTGAQYGLAVASSTALTVPATATIAEITVEGAAIRYTTDGATTPTASVGEGPFPIGTTLTFNLTGLAAVRIIQTQASATINVEYFK